MNQLLRWFLAFAHKYDWHYAPVIGPLNDGSYQRWCKWCGFRETTRQPASPVALQGVSWYSSYAPQQNKSVLMVILGNLCRFEFLDGNVTLSSLAGFPKHEANLTALLEALDIPNRDPRWLSFALLRRHLNNEPILELLQSA